MSDRTNIAHSIHHITEALGLLGGLAKNGEDKHINIAWHELHDALHYVTFSFRERGGKESRYGLCDNYIEEDYMEEITEV